MALLKKPIMIFDDDSVIIPGIKKLFQEMSPHFRFVVLTPSTTEEMCKKLLSEFGETGAKLFEFVFQNTSSKIRENWEFLEVLGVCNVSPKDAVFLSGVPSRIHSANLEKIICLGRHNSLVEDQTLLDGGAKYIVYDYTCLTSTIVCGIMREEVSKKSSFSSSPVCV